MILRVTLTMAVELVIILYVMIVIMNASNATGSNKDGMIMIIIITLY